MTELLLRLLVLVGIAFTSNPEKTEQLICFEKKVKHNICVDCHDGEAGGEHDGEHDPPGAGDGGGKSLLLELELLLHHEGHPVCHSVENREGKRMP